MKKRMLITTIVMALVIVMAMTTATFAWFSTSSSVTVSGLTISARTVTGAQLILRQLSGARVEDTWQAGNISMNATGKLNPVSGILPADEIGASAATLPSFAVSTSGAIFHEASDVVITTNQPATVANQNVKTRLITEDVTALNAGANNFVTTVFQVADANASYTNAGSEGGNTNPVPTSYLIVPELKIGTTADAGLTWTATTKDNLLAGAVKIAFYEMVDVATSDADDITAQTPGYDVDAAAYTYNCLGIWAPYQNHKADFTAGAWTCDTGDVNVGENNAKYLTNTVGVTTQFKYTDLTGVDADASAEATAPSSKTIPTYTFNATDATVGDVPAYSSNGGLAITAGGKLDAGFRFHLSGYGAATEIVIVAWLDGFDTECVNGASGGNLSLQLTIS